MVVRLSEAGQHALQQEARAIVAALTYCKNAHIDNLCTKEASETTHILNQYRCMASK